MEDGYENVRKESKAEKRPAKGRRQQLSHRIQFKARKPIINLTTGWAVDRGGGEVLPVQPVSFRLEPSADHV